MISKPEPTPDTPKDTVPEVVPERHIVPEFPEGVSPPLPTETTPAPSVPPPVPQFIESSGVQLTGKIRQTPKARKAQAGKVKAPVKTPTLKTSGYPVVTTVSALRSLVVTFAAAVIVSTIFMWWTSPDFLPVSARKELAPVQATAAQRAVLKPTPLPTPIWFNKIGIVAGHSGLNRVGQPDPGAVCADGFNELTVTSGVADRVAAMLRGRGFTVDVLGEFDPLRVGYQAAAYISLHADSCENFGYGGFKSTAPGNRMTVREQDTRLNECIRQNYAAITGLEFQPGNITLNMLNYHHWEVISPNTPAVILELGFLSYDRDLLQNQQDRLALGIVNGLICYLAPQTAPGN